MRKTYTILSALLSLICTTLLAQQTPVRIKVIRADEKPVSFATIKVTSAADSSQFFEKAADSLGRAIFNLSSGAQYTVSVSATSIKPVQKGIAVKGESPLFIITAELLSKSKDTVFVTSARPLMRQVDDKTVIDPENLAATSTNAYEIIEKTPGLFVDSDGNIYLSTTTPATVYINGREQKMSAADIATLLKNLPPNAIASIEVMRTPSARVDASATGGIVNVILKKGVRIGFTGSATLGMNQGRYGNQTAGINLNNTSGALSTYLNLQYSRRDNYQRLQTDRIFSADSLLSQEAWSRYPGSSYYVGYGLSYELNKKWEIAYDGRFSYGKANNRTANHSVIAAAGTFPTSITSDNMSNIQNKADNYNLTQGVNLKYKIDSIGSEWTTDLSYTYAPNHTDQYVVTENLLPIKAKFDYLGDIDNKLQFFSGQTNLSKKLKGNVIFETGLKTTAVSFDNTTGYIFSSGRSTRAYRYKETINAAYLQASKKVSGITFKGGVRMENTNMRGRQLSPRDTSFNIHRTDFFPYVYISRNLMKIATYDLRAYLVYRRTISRPAYEYLNPSIRTVDQYLYETGNPALRPQFTQNYEANVSVDERPILAIGVNDTRDIFTQVIYQSDTSNKSVAYRTYDNLGHNKETYFRALGALPPGKRYFFVAGVQYNHNFYNGLYESKPLSFKRGSWALFTYQTFKITPLTQLSLNGFVRFKGQQQFYELGSFGALNLNLSQQFFKKKLVVTLNGSDLFYTYNNTFTLAQGSVKASGSRREDTRRFGINLRYNFGSRKKEDNNLFNIESPEGK